MKHFSMTGEELREFVHRYRGEPNITVNDAMGREEQRLQYALLARALKRKAAKSGTPDSLVGANTD